MFYFNARNIEDLDFVEPQDKMYFDFEPVGVNLYARRKFNKKRYRRKTNKI